MHHQSFKVQSFDHSALNSWVSEEEKFSLKNKAADNLLWRMFERCNPVKGDGEIVVLGQVMYDGQGDWLSMINTCKHLQKKFPDRTVRLISSSAKAHEDKLPDPQLKAMNIIYSDNFNATSLSEFPLDWDILGKIQNAALIFIGPIDLWKIKNETINDEIATRSIAFNEYDAETNFSTVPNKFTMGLSNESIGIFTKSTRKKDDWTWSSLENDCLKKFLFNTLSPDPVQIEEYLSKTAFFFAYMKATSFNKFITDAVIFANANSPTKSIDICFPCKGAIKELKNLLPYDQLENLGIGTIQIIYFENGKCIEDIFELAENGKELYIFDVGRLSIKDFKKLIFLGESLVGVTGDNSIAQALSFGKIPYYECPRHKQKFIENLASLIDFHCGEPGHPLSNYLRATVRQEITKKFISDKSLTQQAKLTGEIIKKNYSVNSVLKGMANHQLLIHSNQDYKQVEASLREQYISSKITIEAFETKIHEELRKIGMTKPLANEQFFQND